MICKSAYDDTKYVRSPVKSPDQIVQNRSHQVTSLRSNHNNQINDELEETRLFNLTLSESALMSEMVDKIIPKIQQQNITSMPSAQHFQPNNTDTHLAQIHKTSRISYT